MNVSDPMRQRTATMANPGGIVIAADHAGVPLKRDIAQLLIEAGRSVLDLGAHDGASVDYPDFAHRVAELVTAPGAGGAQAGEGSAAPAHRFGILVCGSGVGMSIAANRNPGVRAVVCSEPYSAAMARRHNDANVLCLGARVVGTGLAWDIVEAFLAVEFEGGRHARRVAKIERPQP
jgi:ribose 5-phosphate isomerase B